LEGEEKEGEAIAGHRGEESGEKNVEQGAGRPSLFVFRVLQLCRASTGPGPPRTSHRPYADNASAKDIPMVTLLALTEITQLIV